MVLRSVAVLGTAVLVATSPGWLEFVGSLAGAQDSRLLFSAYWVSVPAALAIAVSWVYEMGSANESDIQRAMSAGGAYLTGGAPPREDRRSDASRTQVGGPALSQTSVWKRLETDFKEILNFGADLDATWKRTSTAIETAEYWKLSGVYEEQRIIERFEVLAKTAGKMLLEWPGYRPPLSAATLHQNSPRNRWLCALRDREINAAAWAPGQVSEGDTVTGHVHGGLIRGCIEASVELCVQLTLEESLEERSDSGEESLGARLILSNPAK